MLPFHQFAREGYVHSGPVVVRSKSGFMADDSGAVRVDAGIVEIADGPRWVIALMTEGHPDHRFHPDHPGMVPERPHIENCLRRVGGRRSLRYWGMREGHERVIVERTGEAHELG